MVRVRVSRVKVSVWVRGRRIVDGPIWGSNSMTVRVRVRVRHRVRHRVRVRVRHRVRRGVTSCDFTLHFL